MNLKCSPTPLQHQNHRPRGGCRAATGRLRPPAKFAGYELLRCSAGVPDGLCRGKEVFLVPGQTWCIPDAFHTSESDHCTAIFEI